MVISTLPTSKDALTVLEIVVVHGSASTASIGRRCGWDDNRADRALAETIQNGWVLSLGNGIYDASYEGHIELRWRGAT